MKSAAELPSLALAGAILDRVQREQSIGRREAAEAIARAGRLLGLVPAGNLN